MGDDEPDTPAPPPVATTLAADVPDEEIASVRDVSFPIAMRGYERAAVDAYVTRVNRIIAELQVSRSPRSAIRHALDQVSDETRGILEQDVDAVRKEGNRLLDDVRQASDNLRALVDVAAERFPPEPGEPDANTVTIDRDDLRVDEAEADG